jgi:hypothetical protein
VEIKIQSRVIHVLMLISIIFLLDLFKKGDSIVLNKGFGLFINEMICD